MRPLPQPRLPRHLPVLVLLPSPIGITDTKVSTINSRNSPHLSVTMSIVADGGVRDDNRDVGPRSTPTSIDLEMAACTSFCPLCAHNGPPALEAHDKCQYEYSSTDITRCACRGCRLAWMGLSLARGT